MISRTVAFNSGLTAAMYGSLLFALFMAGCSASVDPSDRDLLEHERVWQFCNVFSIYQNRIPSHREALQVFNSPGAIVRALNDTLHPEWAKKATVIGKYAGRYEELDWGFTESASAHSKQASEHVTLLRLTDSTLYLRFPEFFENTGSEVLKAVRPFSASSVSNIVIDLINNPGGFVDACTTIVEAFLPEGKDYLKVDQREFASDLSSSRTVEGRVWSSKRSNGMLEDLNISILVNRFSASASEILTVALRDVLGPDRVYVVGDSTYGKAIGQYRFTLAASGAGMILTGFRFYRIDATKGDYHEKGIAPDTIIFNRSPVPDTADYAAALIDAVSHWGDSAFSVSPEELFQRYHSSRPNLGKAAAVIDLGEQSLPEL